MSYCTINSFKNFEPGKAKQMVPCSYDGYVIGDGILFYLDKDELLFVGRAPTVNWLQFQAETGGFKVEVIRDDRSPSHPRGKAVTRRHYRFQVQGPNAAKVLDEAQRRTAAGHQVLQLGHDQHQGPQGPRAAPRHGRRAGARDLGPVRRGRRDPRGDPRGRARLRPGAGRFARLRQQHARVRLDPLAAAGRVHRRHDEEVPRVAAGHRLRGHRLDRRQLRLEQHRGLLPHAVRTRLRPVREVRSRLRRPRGAREDGAASRTARR